MKMICDANGQDLRKTRRILGTGGSRGNRVDGGPNTIRLLCYLCFLLFKSI